jgi:hypothetical protein
MAVICRLTDPTPFVPGAQKPHPGLTVGREQTLSNHANKAFFSCKSTFTRWDFKLSTAIFS